MRLGLLTAAFPTLSLEEIATWSSAAGFEALEVACWPAASGEARRYAGVCHIDADALDPDEIHGTLARHGLEISALAYYPNNLHSDDAERAHANGHLLKVIDAAATLGVPTVGTFVGNAKDLPPAENLRRFREIWPPLVAHAGERGVRIAIENCPMIFSPDEWPGGGNLAWSPAIWDELFAECGGSAVGEPSRTLAQAAILVTSALRSRPRLQTVWSKTRWTADWYLRVRWAWLIASIGLTVVSAVTSFGTGIVLGAVLVAYNVFLLRVTYIRRADQSP